jgi:ABC-2 type transport system permease protein
MSLQTQALPQGTSYPARTWRKVRALFNAWLAHMTAYRAEIVIWMLVGMLPLIMMAIWIGKAQQSGGELQGFTPQGFAAYFLAAWVSQQLTAVWVSWEMDFQIRHGNFSVKLLRPLDPFWEFFAQHFTERLVRAPFIVLIVMAGVFLVPGTVLTPDAWHALAYLLVITLAFVMRFMISYCVGMLCFWFENATAFDDFYYMAASFLSGAFAPLEFFPPAIRAVIEFTPFPYIVYYPARVLTGVLEPAEIVRVVLVQLAWLVGLWLLSRLMWRAGLKKYGAVGA